MQFDDIDFLEVLKMCHAAALEHKTSVIIARKQQIVKIYTIKAWNLQNFQTVIFAIFFCDYE